MSTRISPEATRKMDARRRRSIRRASFLILTFFLITCGLYAVFLSGSGEPTADSNQTGTAGSPSVQTEAAVVFWVGMFAILPSGAAYCGGRMFMEISIVVATDLIDQASNQLKALEGSPRCVAHYDKAMSNIQQAHEITVRLSALLAPTQLANMGLWLLLGTVWGTGALVPRDTVVSRNPAVACEFWVFLDRLLVVAAGGQHVKYVVSALGPGAADERRLAARPVADL
jgi:hypothetical protein